MGRVPPDSAWCEPAIASAMWAGDVSLPHRPPGLTCDRLIANAPQKSSRTKSSYRDLITHRSTLRGDDEFAEISRPRVWVLLDCLPDQLFVVVVFGLVLAVLRPRTQRRQAAAPAGRGLQRCHEKVEKQLLMGISQRRQCR